MEALKNGLLIIDFGSQFTLLITRRVRELNVYSEIWSADDARIQGLDSQSCKGIIFSGGPASVYEAQSNSAVDHLIGLDLPLLGICYGMQLIAERGGTVEKSKTGEYGRSRIRIRESSGMFLNVPNNCDVWMSHGDHVVKAPPGFKVTARTENGLIAAFDCDEKKIWGMQFHPEVSHTKYGSAMLQNFIRLCDAPANWDVGNLVEKMTKKIRDQIPENERVICGLSGGVDSAVTAALMHRAIGERLVCVMVDNGLLRHQEVEEVKRIFEGHFGAKLIVEDAAQAFLDDLKGECDPEKKRKIIGHRFIEVFQKSAKNIDNAAWLAQGTLYPDVIESISLGGPSATIKSHHNVGGLPEELGFKLVEPLREFFKDEVRELGRSLGLPEEFVARHPFPGPGLAVRVLGEVTPERVETVRQADHIFISALHEFGHYSEVWQGFAVLLPVKTVGVMGDARTYEDVIALRAVTSVDGMTADRCDLPISFLGLVSDRIINRVKHVNRVVYDITSKPPGTIEWE